MYGLSRDVNGRTLIGLPPPWIAVLATTGSRQLPESNRPIGAPGGHVLHARSYFDALAPKYGALFDLLSSRAPTGQLPGRQHFDPLTVPEHMGYLNLVEVHRNDGLRFRFRLHGTMQTDAAGRDITGRFIEDAVIPEFVDRINGNMTKVVETRRPVYDRFQMPHPNRGYLDSERVYYPLASDGSTVDMILILNGYY